MLVSFAVCRTFTERHSKNHFPVTVLFYVLALPTKIIQRKEIIKAVECLPSILNIWRL